MSAAISKPLLASSIAEAYREDTRHIVPAAAALCLGIMSLEAFSHVGDGANDFVYLHVLLVVISAVVLLASRYSRVFNSRPEIGALVIWITVMVSIGYHALSAGGTSQELTLLILSVVVLAAASLILPTVAGLFAFAGSSVSLFGLFWYSSTSSPLRSLTIPMSIVAIAILIRFARCRSIEERVVREKLTADLQKQELRVAESDAASRTAAQLSARFAHHFNNQLQSVVLSADGASMELTDDHPASEFIDTIRLSALRAARMIEALLRYADSRPQERTRFSVRSMLNKLDLESQVSEGVSLKQDICDVTIHADREQVAIAVEELVVNANRAMTGRTGEIHLAVSSVDDSVDICVSDQGRGFSADIADSATGAFVTGDPVTRFGLGLAFVQSVAEQHAGELTIAHSDAGGAQVCLRLKGVRV